MKDKKFRLGKLKKILLVLCLIFIVVAAAYGIESAIIYNREPSTKYVQSTRPTCFFMVLVQAVWPKNIWQELL